MSASCSNFPMEAGYQVGPLYCKKPLLTRKTTDDIIDMLLDQEGFECDPINKREGDTPLHSAVRWANEVPQEQKEFATSLIEMMLEAGSDPR